ncbi:MAG: nuclease-related domain-containing protein [Jatrophihabitans sp.]|uniref:nuclease-related domain-containing protein n=1 Tax=Jatrophihabitans sp. TaxID=1932789 RepID=UPI003F81675E
MTDAREKPRRHAISARLEQRRLAGDQRAGSWARGEAARRELAFVQRVWRVFAVMLLVAAGLITSVAFLVPAGFVRGLVVGALATAALASLCVMTMQASGSAWTRMGATAEHWTASELRPLQRSGWRLLNHYLLGSEIDHLLIGPAGVIVVETKWSRTTYRLDGTDRLLADALTQVKRNARQVELWNEVRAARCTVQSVLFLWDAEPAQGPPPEEPVVIDGVHIITGRRTAAAWRRRVEQTGQSVAPDALDKLVAAAIEQLAKRDRHVADAETLAPSIERGVWIACGCVIAALTGCLIVLEPLSHGWRWLTLPVGVAAVAAGLFARRIKVIRLVADAWLAAVIAAGVLAAIAEAIG